MKQIYLDFNRYCRLGLHPREALGIALMKHKARKLLANHEAQRDRAAKVLAQ